jgi:hypothetical protein
MLRRYEGGKFVRYCRRIDVFICDAGCIVAFDCIDMIFCRFFCLSWTDLIVHYRLLFLLVALSMCVRLACIWGKIYEQQRHGQHANIMWRIGKP